VIHRVVGRYREHNAEYLGVIVEPACSRCKPENPKPAEKPEAKHRRKLSVLPLRGLAWKWSYGK
jgi:hypothetical protein